MSKKRQNAGQKRSQKNKKRQQKKQRQQQNGTSTPTNAQTSGMLKPNEDFSAFTGPDGRIFEPAPKPEEKDDQNVVDAIMQQAPEIPHPPASTITQHEWEDGSIDLMLGDGTALKIVDIVLKAAAERADKDELWRIYHTIWPNILQTKLDPWDISGFPAADDSPSAFKYISMSDREYALALVRLLGRYLNGNYIRAGIDLSQDDPKGYMNLPMPDVETMLDATFPPKKASQV